MTNLVQFSSVAQSCPTLCDPMNRSTPGLPVYHQLPEFTQTHVHRVRDAIQPSLPRSSLSPPAPNPSWQHIKKQRHYFADKCPSRQSYGFSSSLLWLWELDYKESSVLKNWCFWIVVLEKTLESPLDCKEIQPVHSEGDQPWDFFGRNDAEAEAPVLWPPHAKSWLIGKVSDAGKDWGQEEKGTTQDEMAGWHHRLRGRESEWTPGDGDGQGGLACCDSCGCK